MAKVEKLAIQSAMWKKPGQRKWWKQRTSKLMRRAAKVDPEDAPNRKPIRGWSD